MTDRCHAIKDFLFNFWLESQRFSSIISRRNNKISNEIIRSNEIFDLQWLLFVMIINLISKHISFLRLWYLNFSRRKRIHFCFQNEMGDFTAVFLNDKKLIGGFFREDFFEIFLFNDDFEHALIHWWLLQNVWSVAKMGCKPLSDDQKLTFWVIKLLLHCILRY